MRLVNLHQGSRLKSIWSQQILYKIGTDHQLTIYLLKYLKMMSRIHHHHPHLKKMIKITMLKMPKSLKSIDFDNSLIKT